MLKSEKPRDTRSLIAAACAVFLLTILVFASSLQAGFVDWDDGITVLGNPTIRALDGEHLKRMFLGSERSLRFEPLAWLGWAINFRWHGLDPFGYHLVNVLLHAANAALLFWLLAGFILPAGPSRLFLAVVVTLLWALHPLRVEPVAWVTGRRYPQALFFMLSAMLFYLRSQWPPLLPGTGRRDYYAALTFFALSLLSYPIGMTFVGLFLLINIYWLRRSLVGAIKSLAPFLLLSVAILGVALFVRYQAGGIWRTPVTLEDFGLGSRLAQAAYVIVFYLVKPLSPLQLAPVYTDLLAVDPLHWKFLGSVGIVLLLSLFAYARRRAQPMLWVLWLAYLMLTIPFLGLSEAPHYPNDRYSYLNGIIVAIAGASAIGLGLARRHRLQEISAAILVIGCALLSMAQIPVWQNSITLFQQTLKTLGEHPYGGDIDWRLAKSYLQKGEWRLAESHLERANRLQPRNANARMTRCGYLLQRQAFAEAEADCRLAVELQPKSDAHYLLGKLLLATKRRAEGLRHLQSAWQLVPSHPAIEADIKKELATP